MAGLRVHTVMPSELVGRIDFAASAAGVSRGEFVRQAVEQALGSSGRAGVRGRVPASAPAEQPAVPSADLLTTPEVVRAAAAAGVFGGRVRSSSVARPFRPAPKQGKK